MTGETPKAGWLAEFQKVNPRPGTATGPRGASERRMHPRFALPEGSAKLYRRGATALFGLARLSIEGSVVDLSEGGVRIHTVEQILIDTKIHIRVEIAKFEDKIDSDGVARWCHQDVGDKSHFFVGIQFTGGDSSTPKKIARMKAWFTSPQYFALRDQRLRDKK